MRSVLVAIGAWVISGVVAYLIACMEPLDDDAEDSWDASDVKAW